MSANGQQTLGPQNVGAAGGVIPFWAASQNVIFDNFTSDSFTPGASVQNLFQGALGDLKSYGFLDRLWLKFIGTAAPSAGGTYSADGPMNALSVLRVQDPNGHSIIDADSFGLYLLNKYGARQWWGDPLKMQSAVPTALATTVVTTASTPNFELVVPFSVNQEIGLGALSDMDASGPYRIVAQTSVGPAAGVAGSTAPLSIFTTAPTTTNPTIQVQVGGEFFSLPSQASRVNGQPQIQLPPLLDRGLAVVNEYTKQTLTGLVTGQKTYKLPRVGNIISQVILVLRDSSGSRIAWPSSIASGSRLTLSFDSVPLWDADPQHVINNMMRRRPSSLAYDTGVLIFDRASPGGLALIQQGLDGGLDKLMQTAQTTALELTANLTAGASIDVYTHDLTVTNMITGEKYSFAYGGQLLLPAAPGNIRS